MVGVLSGLTCLHLATQKRQHQLLKLLMKKGADLNIKVSLVVHPALVL